MRRPVAEWLLAPLFLLPVLVGVGLALVARYGYEAEMERVRRDGEGEVWRRIEQLQLDGTHWESLLTAALAPETRPGDIPFRIEREGTSSHPLSWVRLDSRSLATGAEAGRQWVCRDGYPIGLSPESLADPEVRFAIEVGGPPARDSVDEESRSLETLLLAPDLPQLRASSLSSRTKLFVARRWRKRHPEDPALREAETLLATLAQVGDWWRGLSSGPKAGVHRAGETTVLVNWRLFAFPPGEPTPAPVVLPLDAPTAGRVRMEYVLTLDESPDPDALWSGRLEEPLAGKWRLVAVHGDAWWRGPAVRQFAGPVLAGLAAFELLPLALLIALVKRRRLDEARRRFITELAHDLRTPLTSVRLYAEMLEAGRVPEEERGEYLSVLAQESTRLSGLLANLLDLSRLERGTRDFDPTVVDVAEVVKASVRDLVAIRPDRADDVSLSGEEGCRAVADPTALARSLANLLENAAKFTAVGVSIRVAWACSAGGVTIRIADEGPGIPASERSRLFDRYARGAAAMRNGVPGTGLGLSLVRELIEGCGGTVRYVPTTAGATFEITLRRAVE